MGKKKYYFLVVIHIVSKKAVVVFKRQQREPIRLDAAIKNIKHQKKICLNRSSRIRHFIKDASICNTRMLHTFPHIRSHLFRLHRGRLRKDSFYTANFSLYRCVHAWLIGNIFCLVLYDILSKSKLISIIAVLAFGN